MLNCPLQIQIAQAVPNPGQTQCRVLLQLYYRTHATSGSGILQKLAEHSTVGRELVLVNLSRSRLASQMGPNAAWTCLRSSRTARYQSLSTLRTARKKSPCVGYICPRDSQELSARWPSYVGISVNGKTGDGLSYSVVHAAVHDGRLGQKPILIFAANGHIGRLCCRDPAYLR